MGRLEFILQSALYFTPHLLRLHDEIPFLVTDFYNHLEADAMLRVL